jgi:hypothetical protein
LAPSGAVKVPAVALPVVLFAACGDNAPSHATDAGGRADAYVATPGGVDLPLVSLAAISYTVQLDLGGQHFAQLVDTGSSTTAVAASACTDCTGVTPTYTPGATAIDLHATASTSYADGSGWAGEIFQDVAHAAGLPSVPLNFVAISSQMMQFFAGNDYQGILGLGPRQLLENGTTDWLDQLGYAGVPKVMAVRLCPDRGDLWIGGFDPAAAAQPVQFTPMLPLSFLGNPFYQMQTADLAFGGASLNFTTADFGPTLVDTGTSESFVPQPVMTALLAAINGNAAFKTMFKNKKLADTPAGSCVTQAGVTPAMVDAKLPPLTLSFPDTTGTTTFTVTVPPSKSYLSPSGAGMFCLGFSSSGPDASAGSLIGDTVLAGLLVVWDVANLQIGVAAQAGCIEAPLPPLAREAPPGVPLRANPHYRPPPWGRAPSSLR